MKFNHCIWNSIAIAIAVGLSAWTLTPMFASSDFLSWLPVVLGVSAVTGVIGVLVRFPRLLTTGLQAAGMAAVLLWLGFVQAPTPQDPEAPWYEPLILLGGMGTAVVRENSTPLPSSDGLHWLLLCVLALVVLATELLVNALEQPSWSMAPLGVVYAVGALTLPTELDWTAFAAVALGYGLILASSTHLVGTGISRARFRVSRAVGLVAVVGIAAVLAPLLTSFVPLGDKQPWLQAGQNAPIQLSDPAVLLSENLRRPTEQVVLRYTTDSEDPVYLRTVALNLLTTDGAKLTGMTLSSTGLSGDYTAPGREVETQVQMQMPSQYLPVPFAVDDFDADGDWAHDADTMSIVATGQDAAEQTAGLEYEVTSTVPDPEREDLEAAVAGTPPFDDDTLTVPSGLDPDVSVLTSEVTAQSATDGEKALAIQSFLRSEGFQYSLDAPDDMGIDVISNFLLNDQSGYCIHFAAGMITMARLEGIPARMAIGFTPGERDGDEWVVTTYNMHSWPELYFEGLGWVPFEPTKSIAGPPSYTDPDVEGTEPSPSPSASASAAPSAPQSSAAPEVPEEPTADPAPTDADGSNRNGWFLLLGIAVVLGLPFTLRTSLRLWRLRAGQEPAAAAENTWREVRALFTDTGQRWSASSPVLAASEMSHSLAESGTGQLATLAMTVERVRYARGGADTSDLKHQARDFRKSFLAAQPGNNALKALVLPKSLISMRSRRP
ncbi:MAG: transglutaminaseTgpA domain-containing protein [Arachnia sp.]